MKQIDMHVHSKYSEHPSDWYLQRLGAQESYTEPEFIYEMAKEKGMDFVTITDHNRIDGAIRLKEKYPDEVIVGLEATTYFPEDGCKVHILIYDITQEQFEDIQNLRKNIYDLREYIIKNDLAYSVAHATFSINGKLTADHLEKLILMFDVFEVINGGRLQLFNQQWEYILTQLTPGITRKLVDKHQIEPISDAPWVKGFTGGSDDHAGIFIANTYTEMDAEDISDFITKFKEKKSRAGGRHNNYKFLAFSIFKIALEFARNKNKNLSNSMLAQIGEKIFSSENLSLKERFKLYRLKTLNNKNGNQIERLAIEIVDEVKKIKPNHMEKRLEVVFSKLSDMSDAFFTRVIRSLEKDFESGNLLNMVMNLSSSIPGIFLTLPFLTTMKVLFGNRHIVHDLHRNLGMSMADNHRKILWFSDTFTDLNGVSETLQEMARKAWQNNHPIKIVTHLQDKNAKNQFSPNVISLPTFYSRTLPYYESYLIEFPSLLKSIDLLCKEEPTEVVISTPGPIGLIGLAVSRLLDIPCTGIYHTDFTSEVHEIAGDNALTELVESYIKWFYSMMDHIKTPSKEYISILMDRGVERSKIEVLNKAVDLQLFKPAANAKQEVAKKYGTNGGINLLYVGRISKDKNLDFLAEIYDELLKQDKNISLIFAGDGPYKKELEAKLKKYQNVFFTGRKSRQELPEIYSAADLFVFPSTTDTFGMVVMEAQACGVPAVVSDIGGPKEIILPEKTGYIAQNNNLQDWLEKTRQIIELKQNNSTSYDQMKNASIQNVMKKYKWDNFFQQVVEHN